MSTKSRMPQLVSRRSRWLLAAFLAVASIFTTTAPAAQAIPFPPVPAYQSFAGDVNGDGRTDLIWNRTDVTNSIFTGLSQGDGSFALTPPQNTGRGWYYYWTLVGDVNGDGKDDLIWNETLSTGNRVYVGLSQGNGSFAITPSQSVGAGGWQYYRTLVGDVNGDGKDDLIWNETLSTGNRVYVGLSQGNGSFAIMPSQNIGAGGWQDYQAFVGDANGDGKADLIWDETISGSNNVYVGLSQGNGSFTLAPIQHIGAGDWQNYDTRLGDVNGDGKTDMIWNSTSTNGNYTYVGLSQGNGSFTLTPLQSASEGVGNGYLPMVGDINGDGKTDLIWNEAYITSNNVVSGLSQGDGSFVIAPVQNIGAGNWLDYHTLVGDINADGKADLIWNNYLTSGGCIYAGLSQGDGSFMVAQAQCF